MRKGCTFTKTLNWSALALLLAAVVALLCTEKLPKVLGRDPASAQTPQH
ncbi:MAG: hypothetical protein ACXWR1_14495 [Bdellovibrionota bacterium]